MATIIKCDTCGKTDSQAFVLTTCIKTVKPEPEHKEIAPGDYCKECLIRKLQAMIPNKVTTREFTPRAHPCSYCCKPARYEMIAQDSDVLGWSCQDCKDTKPDSSAMYRPI